MEYVAVSVSRPTWLSMSLPQEVAELLRLAPKADRPDGSGRSISFLARGPWFLRAVPTEALKEALAVETVRNRLVATARLGEKLQLSFPIRAAEYLRLELVARSKGLRGVEDPFLWIVPAPEYHASRRGHDAPRKDGADPALPHVYLVRAFVPLPRDLGGLAELESRIEQEEWAPGVEVLQRVGRTRRTAV